MIDQATLLTYLAILLGFVFLPGPAIILTLARATSSGTKVGIGDLIHTAMAVLGLSAIILTSAFLFNLIKYAGAAYLVYLGIRAILEKSEAGADFASSKITTSKALKQAILTEVLNPKSALFFLAFLPQFVSPENGAVAMQLTILGVLFVVMGLFSTMVVSVSAGPIGSFLRRKPGVMRWQGKVVGSIYCALGLRLALQEK